MPDPEPDPESDAQADAQREYVERAREEMALSSKLRELYYDADDEQEPDDGLLQVWRSAPERKRATSDRSQAVRPGSRI